MSSRSLGTTPERTTTVREPAAEGIELSPSEIDRVLAGLRGGMEISIGGSRLHTTYRGRDGAFFIEDFDEGATDERPLAEADLRRVIAGSPGPFLDVLRSPLRAALRDALLGTIEVSPITCMRELLDALPGLRGLGLGHCAIDDAGLAKLVAHPAFARLEVLELDHNRLGPDAGAILARASRLPLRLYLGGNRLGDAGARALAAASAAARVDELLLQDNCITDAGAAALVDGSSQLVSTIGRLCLHENILGEDAVKACTDKLGKRLCFELPMAP
jgi:Leucine Rich repeat